jgi:hypothetical protein
MEMPPDTLEGVGVNELFVAVTFDASFTTEQAVVGRIDEIHILIAVRTAPIVGYVSPSHERGDIEIKFVSSCHAEKYHSAYKRSAHTQSILHR